MDWQQDLAVGVFGWKRGHRVHMGAAGVALLGHRCCNNQFLFTAPALPLGRAAEETRERISNTSLQINVCNLPLRAQLVANTGQFALLCFLIAPLKAI